MCVCVCVMCVCVCVCVCVCARACICVCVFVCGAVWYGMAPYRAAWLCVCSAVRCGAVWYGAISCCVVVQYGVLQCSAQAPLPPLRPPCPPCGPPAPPAAALSHTSAPPLMWPALLSGPG